MSSGGDVPPPVNREFRGLWVATVANIDWPSRPGLPVREQKAELLAIFDRAVRLGFNAIVLQVRPACDAIYESKLEPWTEYLTGEMGRAPAPFYDPLTFAVDEAHKRGLELHAWFNPYRARLRESKSPVARTHVSKTHPGVVRTYGKYLWLDPTEPETRQYVRDVVLDVVKRYDIDGVHFDDYFYPYPEKALVGDSSPMDFPDGAAWSRYVKGGGKLSRGDWRRENVDLFVQSLYSDIKAAKPWVKFGISPFGIWQPKHPESIGGFDAYEKLYCDSRRWLVEGWVDYMAPQLYWPIAQREQSFSTLLNWWTAQNPKGRLLMAGMRAGGWKNVSNDTREALAEIEATRRGTGKAGVILWHSKSLVNENASLARALENTIFAEPALVPSCPWLSAPPPVKPDLTARIGSRDIRLAWRAAPGAAWQWVVRSKLDGRWSTQILPGSQTKVSLARRPNGPVPEILEVSAVNRCGAVSEPAILANNPPAPTAKLSP